MSLFRPGAARRLAILAMFAFALMVLPGTSVWATARSIASRSAAAVGRVFSPTLGRSASPAAAAGGAPTIGATMTATLTTDSGGDSKADPGDVIHYSTAIANTGTDATGVHFADSVPAGTTLVPGSVHASPLAVDDTYNWVGNTVLDTNARSLPSLTDNDSPTTDAFVLDTTPATLPTHGSVTLSSNGHFVYTPNVGYTGSDSFTYTIKNSVDNTLTGTGTVTINLTNAVWYLQAGASGDGRSNTPSGNPAAVSALAAASQYFYVFSSGGTLNGAFTLKSGQQLLGQGTALTVNSISLFPAVTHPTIQNTAGDAVTLNSGNTLNGFVIGDTSGKAIVGANVGALAVDNVAINTTKQALDLTGVGTPTVNVILASVTSGGGTQNVNLVDLGGSVSLGSGTMSGATGTAFVVNGGSATVVFSGTVTQNTAGQRLAAVSNTTGGVVSFNNGAANALVSGGTGILIDGAAGNVIVNNADLNGSRGIEILGDAGNIASGTYTFNNVTIDTTAGAGNHAFIVDGDQGTPANNKVTATINLNNVDITNPGGLVASIQGMNSGSITFDAASAILRNNGGLGISATSNAGGTVTFNSTTKTLTTNTNAAVSLTNNTGATFNFVGGNLAITTTSGAGFAATGGGTVTVTGAGNIVNATAGGTALNVANTTIGASGLTFQSVSASGATNGIVLNNTGTAAGNGGLTVSGNAGTCTLATPTCTGGSIQTSTGSGISLTTTKNTSLAFMKIQDSGTNGIAGSGVNGFSIANSIVTDAAGNVTVDDGIGLSNSSGAVSITSSAISGARHQGITIDNNNTNMTSLTMTGSTVTGTPGGDGMLIQMRGTSVMTTGTIGGATIALGNTFSGNSATGFQVNNIDTGNIASLTVENNTFSNNNAGVDLDISPTAASLTAVVRTNTFNGQHTTALNMVQATGATGGSLTATVVGNLIGTAGVIDSGSAIGTGIRVANGGVNVSLTIDSNVIREVPNGRGIDIEPQAYSVNLSLKAKIVNNTIVRPTGTNQDLGCGFHVPCPSASVFVLSDSNLMGGFDHACTVVSGNSAYDPTSWPAGGEGAYYFARRTSAVNRRLRSPLVGHHQPRTEHRPAGQRSRRRQTLEPVQHLRRLFPQTDHERGDLAVASQRPRQGRFRGGVWQAIAAVALPECGDRQPALLSHFPVEHVLSLQRSPPRRRKRGEGRNPSRPLLPLSGSGADYDRSALGKIPDDVTRPSYGGPRGRRRRGSIPRRRRSCRRRSRCRTRRKA